MRAILLMAAVILAAAALFVVAPRLGSLPAAVALLLASGVSALALR